MAMRNRLAMTALIAASMSLTACDTFFGEEDGPPLPGERISVLRLNRTLVADPAISDLRVRLPEPYPNSEWPQPGGFSSHAMHHLAAPAASGGRVFALTIDNQLFVLAAEDGRQLWTYAGVAQDAGLLGGSTPAVAGNRVVAAFSSGDIVAFDTVSGSPLWTDSLAAAARGDAIATLADIRGLPVIDRDRVIAVSNSGTFTAVEIERGGRLWNARVGGSQTPWVAGDFVYVLTTDGELLCVTRDEGRVRWIQSLPLFEDEVERDNPITWAGPVLLGDRLIVTSSAGDALSISPYTGDALGRVQLPSSSHLPPIVANNTMYLLADNGELTAYR